jgi:hypothetical protein
MATLKELQLQTLSFNNNEFQSPIGKLEGHIGDYPNTVGVLLWAKKQDWRPARQDLCWIHCFL